MKALSIKYHLLILCVSGTLFRLLYGFFFTPWNQAPDQIAWEILIKSGGISYDALIHYPHEGGTLLISLLSHSVQFFTDFNSLVISACILDFVSRFIQLHIVQKVFNTKIAYIFGVWTLFAGPSIIPWGTVNFGLHSISSFFPFILLYIIWLNNDSSKCHMKNGLIMGMAFWFSYSNIVLIYVYFLFQIFRNKRSRNWIYALSSLAAVMVLHLLVRYSVDAGFHFGETNLTSIRGTSFALNDVEIWKRMYRVWAGPLADSAIAVPYTKYLIKSVKYIWISIVFLGLIGYACSFAKNMYYKRLGLNLLTIFFFVLIYAVSPFYFDAPHLGNYVAYRHLTYILPCISLFTIVGLCSLKYRTVWVTIFLVIGMYGSSLLFTQKVFENTEEKAAGWVLGVKLGHDPERLYRIISSSNYDHTLLLQGVGWGISTSLFTENEYNKSKTVLHNVNKLMAIVNRFPKDCRSNLVEGVKFSFSDVVTPRLKKDIFLTVQDEYKKANDNVR